MSKRIYSALITVFGILVSGCTSDAALRDAHYYQNYYSTLNCQKRLGYISPPLCISTSYFDSKEEFSACKKSIDSYSKEIERWKHCRLEFLNTLNKRVTKDVNRSMLCLNGRQAQDPPCPLYKPPADLQGQGYYFSVREKEKYRLLNWQNRCAHLQHGMVKYTATECSVASQKYLDDVFRKLKKGYQDDINTANKYRDKTIEKFNCKANSNDGC